MARPSSVAVKIKYAHVAKDGRTPIYNAVSKEWTYHDSPSFEQLNTSAIHLKDISSNALSAITKSDSAIVSADTAQGLANTAKDLADAAQQTADLKVTAEEAVEKVKESLFFITRREGVGSIGGNKLRLELFEDDAENWYFRVHAMRGASSGDNTIYTLPLSYVSQAEYVDLLMRLLAIEQRLGIS